MNPKEPSEPKDAMASVWEKGSLEGEHFQHDDQNEIGEEIEDNKLITI
jgi:hypothetical protein